MKFEKNEAGVESKSEDKEKDRNGKGQQSGRAEMAEENVQKNNAENGGNKRGDRIEDGRGWERMGEEREWKSREDGRRERMEVERGWERRRSWKYSKSMQGVGLVGAFFEPEPKKSLPVSRREEAGKTLPITVVS
ncbi:uncharacterized protein BP5553_03251 [Venustampulla echinocandica]|uniref:Uncharacterized protein n=1 Tax=Venustampulla echinocandica TaxID=2656787 RepID=A0A370TTQ8_9HELO|nr:uncharacterized protein BP5553_03251 [Venustampulla echinocandica]RDL38911.1 hypothetical protein BP5553_03251 [Venustampulla echinocandica]